MQNKEPQEIAKVVALTFMGVRADKWPKERLAGMAGFFSKIGYKPTSEWKEEIVFQLAQHDAMYRKRLEARLHAQARILGYHLVPATGQSVS